MTDTAPEIAPEHILFLARLGEIVVSWNQLQASLQLMVYRLAGGHRADILTAHMGAVSLSDGLRTLSTEFGPEELREHIAHFLELFDRLRAYRNHYVHAVLMIGRSDEDKPIGFAQTTIAKRRLMLHQASVTIDELDRLSLRIAQASSYASGIICELWDLDKSPVTKPPPSSPQKPPLPDKLVKPALPLLDDQSRRQSSLD